MTVRMLLIPSARSVDARTLRLRLDEHQPPPRQRQSALRPDFAEALGVLQALTLCNDLERLDHSRS
jgi:hypothetical protein